MASPRLRNLDEVARSFSTLGATVHRPAPDLCSFPTLWGDRHLWIRWDAEHALILISQTLPPVAVDAVPRAAVEIQRIHLQIAVLGFVLDPDSGGLDFRTHIPLLADGSLRRDLLHRTFRFVIQTCERQAVRVTLGPELVTPWWADEGR